MRLYNNVLMLIFVALFLIVASIVVISEDKSNKISGNIVNTHVEVLPVSSKNCSFHLNPGWNMVSFYCLGLFSDRSVVLGSIDGYYGSIFEYNSNDATDPWKSYNPELPSWTVQQLTHMDRISGYWIYMHTDADFNYPGIYSDSVIYLYNGWNFVGYPNTNRTNINVSLNGIPFTVVKYYNTTSNTWQVYVNGSPSNTLNYFETYKGYWINVNGNPQWIITRG